jgi:hypothetical protein
MQQPEGPVQQAELLVQRPEAPDLDQALDDLARDTRLTLDQTQEINQAQEVTNAWLRLLHEIVDQNNERMRAMETLLRQVLDERRRPDVAAETYSPSPLPPNAE